MIARSQPSDRMPNSNTGPKTRNREMGKPSIEGGRRRSPLQVPGSTSHNYTAKFMWTSYLFIKFTISPQWQLGGRTLVASIIYYPVIRLGWVNYLNWISNYHWNWNLERYLLLNRFHNKYSDSIMSLFERLKYIDLMASQWCSLVLLLLKALTKWCISHRKQIRSFG